MVVGRRSFPFGARSIFRGELLIWGNVTYHHHHHLWKWNNSTQIRDRNQIWDHHIFVSGQPYGMRRHLQCRIGLAEGQVGLFGCLETKNLRGVDEPYKVFVHSILCILSIYLSISILAYPFMYWSMSNRFIHLSAILLDSCHPKIKPKNKTKINKGAWS